MRQRSAYLFVIFSIIFLGILMLLVVKAPFKNEIQVESEVEIKSQIPVTFLVGDASHQISVPVGSSVYDAMNNVASTTSFRFVAKHFSGLGYFIEQINGVKNVNGAFWTLYINGIYSTVGASEYRLKDGDLVEWKFEKK
ncbi:MAG: DUF4430 domain-containing protein [Patescibacteria group bacterium]